MNAAKYLKHPRFNTIIYWSAITLLVLLFYGWRLNVLTVFPFNYDEGIHLILGRLWAAGHIPYQEIFVSYPPSFLWSLGIPWKLFSRAEALQLVMATYALAGVLAVIYLGTVYHSRLAGITAGIILAFTPDFFIPSFAIMTEVPSISMAVLAIALAEKYRRSGGWVWALLTGIGLGFGLSLKLLPYYAAPLIALMFVARYIEGPGSRIHHLFNLKWKLLGDGAILAAGFLLTLILPVLVFDYSTFFDQVIAMRLVSRQVDNNPFESNNQYIRDFLFSNPGVTMLALYGFVFVVARKPSRYWLLITWFALIWMSMAFLVPLRTKHLPIFLPILAIVAGFGFSHSYNFLQQIRIEGLSARAVAMVLTIATVLGVVVWHVPDVIARNNGYTLEENVNKERQTAIKFIDRIAAPDDCVIADNPVFLYQTNRLPPPELSETSQTRIDTGYLTLQDVIRIIKTYQCHVVAVVTPRFGESIPGLTEWLAENYVGLHAQSETFVYFAPKEQITQQETPRTYTLVQHGQFDSMARLEGFQLSREGHNTFYLSLYWQLISPFNMDYREQITLRNAANNQDVFRLKRTPLEGHFTPAGWPLDEQVRDTLRLDIPAELPPGNYNLNLSLCALETGECLPVNNQTQTELHLSPLNLVK